MTMKSSTPRGKRRPSWSPKRTPLSKRTVSVVVSSSDSDEDAEGQLRSGPLGIPIPRGRPTESVEGSSLTRASPSIPLESTSSSESESSAGSDSVSLRPPRPSRNEPAIEGSAEQVVVLRTDLPILTRGAVTSSPRANLYSDPINTTAGAGTSTTQPTKAELRAMNFTQWLQWWSTTPSAADQRTRVITEAQYFGLLDAHTPGTHISTLNVSGEMKRWLYYRRGSRKYKVCTMMYLPLGGQAPQFGPVLVHLTKKGRKGKVNCNDCECYCCGMVVWWCVIEYCTGSESEVLLSDRESR
jgi:hypothetical protein